MPSLKWSISHAVFVTDIDDQHKEIFQAAAALQNALGSPASSTDVRKAAERLVTRMTDHFAHEERLMLAARYEAIDWHCKKHDAALSRVEFYRHLLEGGDAAAGKELIQYLTAWLPEHTRLADRMLGAFLRNQRRMGKLTIRAGTKSAQACTWVGADGEILELPKETEV